MLKWFKSQKKLELSGFLPEKYLLTSVEFAALLAYILTFCSDFYQSKQVFFWQETTKF